MYHIAYLCHCKTKQSLCESGKNRCDLRKSAECESAGFSINWRCLHLRIEWLKWALKIWLSLLRHWWLLQKSKIVWRAFLHRSLKAFPNMWLFSHFHFGVNNKVQFPFTICTLCSAPITRCRLTFTLSAFLRPSERDLQMQILFLSSSMFVKFKQLPSDISNWCQPEFYVGQLHDSN